MFFIGDDTVALDAELVTVCSNDSVHYMSPVVAEKYNVADLGCDALLTFRGAAFDALQDDCIPVSADERQHTASFDRDRDTLPRFQEPGDFREEQVVVYYHIFSVFAAHNRRIFTKLHKNSLPLSGN